MLVRIHSAGVDLSVQTFECFDCNSVLTIPGARPNYDAKRVLVIYHSWARPKDEPPLATSLSLGRRPVIFLNAPFR